MRAAVVVVVLMCGCQREERAAGREPPAQKGGAPPAGTIKEPPPPPPEPENPALRVGAASSIAEAIDLAKPLMADSSDQASQGTLAFTWWASDKMRWTDVAVAKNETSTKLVKKDSTEARGKRMCASGQVLQIARVPLEGDRKVYEGLMNAGGYGIDAIHFYAVGSTGSLVEESRARLCGVVMGRYNFSNVSGGTTLSVEMVGMFDLPENRGSR